MTVLDRRVHLGAMGAGDLGRRVGAVVGDHPHRRRGHGLTTQRLQRGRDVELLVAGRDQRGHRDSSRRPMRSSPQSAAAAPPHRGNDEPARVTRFAAHASRPTTSSTERHRGEEPSDHQRRRRCRVHQQHIERSDRHLLRHRGVHAAASGQQHRRRHRNQADPEDQSGHRPHQPRRPGRLGDPDSDGPTIGPPSRSLVDLTHTRGPYRRGLAASEIPNTVRGWSDWQGAEIQPGVLRSVRGSKDCRVDR